MAATTTDSPTSTSTDLDAYQTYKDLVTDYVENGLGLTKGAKIGIAVGASVVGLVIIGMIIFIVIRLRRSKKYKLQRSQDGGEKAGSSSSLTTEEKEAQERRMRALDNM
ncbi:hypothetical protein ABW19_dt0202185 [Dactylella cylindrospora]|nr:hypothetical protein ABW19_dt0202185 [Dactylella cylindrospora]